jgi:RNA polymerase sigma-70 factor, ECF subfamily
VKRARKALAFDAHLLPRRYTQPRRAPRQAPAGPLGGPGRDERGIADTAPDRLSWGYPAAPLPRRHENLLASASFTTFFERLRVRSGGGALHRMASDKELADFLAGVERRAFKQTVYAVRDDDASLDIVQDAMIKLAEKYGDRPAAELPLLFQRILQNTTHDFFRRQKVRNTWVSLFSSLGNADDDEFDPLETFEAQDGRVGAESSEQQLEREQVLNLIDQEIQKLPARQREAFLMRYWEDMDVAETAAAMGCSEGSVKTHCSRATHTLAQALKAKGITL